MSPLLTAAEDLYFHMAHAHRAISPDLPWDESMANGMELNHEAMHRLTGGLGPDHTHEDPH